jgi:2-polyprenyl-6-methoxyphenol hydroxylase-like FAD-dependent oxidoreductase
MRRIAIIGSGIAGMLAALGLRQAGHDVTLYSDRTPDDWMTKSTPTGTAARFPRSLDFDAALGVNHWDDVCPPCEGVSLAFGLKKANRLVALTSRLERPGRAIDVRLLSARWMNDLSERGGRVVIESVTPERLDAIAAENELTVVAAGRKELCSLFARNAERSVYDRPQRKLCLIITRGGAMKLDGVPFLPVRFNLNAHFGEAFWVPFLHKDGEPTWNLLFEAKAGGPMDRFDDAKDGHEALAIAKKVIAELAPWDSAWVQPMTLADDRAWLKGGVTPTVRAPVATLPSGRAVMAIGDTVISLDPIAGQGANCGTRLARHLVDAVAAHPDGALDAAWMNATFESFWEAQGKHIVRFNNLLLEPMTSPGQLLLISQCGSDGVSDTVAQRIANTFTANFDDTSLYTDALVNDVVTKGIIAKAGGSHPWTFLNGVAGVAAGQVRQLFGVKPAHPAHL